MLNIHIVAQKLSTYFLIRTSFVPLYLGGTKQFFFFVEWLKKSPHQKVYTLMNVLGTIRMSKRKNCEWLHQLVVWRSRNFCRAIRPWHGNQPFLNVSIVKVKNWRTFLILNIKISGLHITDVCEAKSVKKGGSRGGTRKGLQDHQGREQDNGTTTHPLRTLVALARQLHQCYALALAQSKYTHYYPYRTNTRKPLS